MGPKRTVGIRVRRHACRERLARGRGPWLAPVLLLPLLTLALSTGARAQARLTAGVAADGHELVLSLGPLDLPAGATHHQVLQPAAQEIAIPQDGWLRGFSLELVDHAGRRVPQAVLHHLNLMMPDRRELFSPIMLRIGAAGEETGPVELPWLMGFKVARGEKVLVTSMFSNEASRQAYQGVTLRVHMPFTNAGTWLPPLSVYPFYIDVMPPAGIHAYDLPPGKSQKSWDAHPATAARLLGLGGHLHRYGTLLRFEDATAGKVLWEARPHLDAHGEVVGMPTGTFWWRGGLKVQPGHVYRVTAFYDNPTGRTIPEGAMGALGGILVPGRGATWPAVNPTDPEYRKDVQVTRAGMQMDMPGMDMRTAPAGAAPRAPAVVPARTPRPAPTRARVSEPAGAAIKSAPPQR